MVIFVCMCVTIGFFGPIKVCGFLSCASMSCIAFLSTVYMTLCYGDKFLPALQANVGAAYEEANSPKWHRPDYYSGFWFPNPDAYNPDLKPPGKCLQDTSFSCTADHKAHFSFEEALATENDTWSNLRPATGDLTLTGFWDRLVTSGKISLHQEISNCFHFK